MHKSCSCHLLPRFPHPLLSPPASPPSLFLPPPPLQPAAPAPPGPALQVPPCSHTRPLQQPELRACSASRRAGSAVPHGNFPGSWRSCPVRSGMLASAGDMAARSPVPARGQAEPPGGGHSPQESPAAPSGNGGGRGAGSITDGGEPRRGRGALPLPSPCPAPPAGIPGEGRAAGTAGPPLRWPPPALLS